MPPDRRVPEMSRALAADTYRTPQPTTHSATTPSHNHRADAMSSSTQRIIGDTAPAGAAKRKHANQPRLQQVTTPLFHGSIGNDGYPGHLLPANLRYVNFDS